MKKSVTASITAQNTFTGWVKLEGMFLRLISGLSDSTVTFQGSPDDGVTVYDIEEWSAATDNGVDTGYLPSTVWVYRIGVKTGDYGTDTVILRLDG